MMKHVTSMALGVCIAAMLVVSSAAFAQEDGGEAPADMLAPPANLIATDHPWDNATKVDLAWTASPDRRVFQYWIYKRIDTIGGQAVDSEWELIEPVFAAQTQYVAGSLPHRIAVEDLKNFNTETDIETLRATGERTFSVAFLFQVIARDATGDLESAPITAGPIEPQMAWFFGDRLWLGIITLVFCGAVVFWIGHARSGRPVRVRKIAGLEAVDEAVGRATEMGRSCLYVPGIQDINDIQTIAGITILSRVARTAAEYDAKVEVPTSKSLVMTTAREAVQAAYLSAGRPDAYNQDLIYYVTDEQFGYVAYLQGMMVREKPAACFYMGSFFAESLILAETGNSIGAIQVAGTAQPAQLPFFVAACDYTLIGEEFFAASAYLSGSPEELGSLKGQDVGKVIVAVLLVIGVVLATLGALIGGPESGDIFERAVNYLQQHVLT